MRFKLIYIVILYLLFFDSGRFFAQKYSTGEEVLKSELTDSVKCAVLREMFETEKKAGNFKDAHSLQKIYRMMKDSISNSKAKKLALQRSVKYEYSKKVLADSISNTQKVKVIEAEVKHQRTEKNFLFAGIALVFLLAAFIYNRLRFIGRQKKLIESQKAEVEHQRNIIEKRSAEIIDSIHYAKRIQLAQLPGANFISKALERLNKN
jgi:hypothetical protein